MSSVYNETKKNPFCEQETFVGFPYKKQTVF